MSDAPESGRVNGSEQGAEVKASQQARYPFLELFAARAVFATRASQLQSEPTGYELRLGLRIGLKVGKSLDLDIPRGAPGALLAGMFRQLADAIDRHVEDCAAAANDERDLLPAALVDVIPAKGQACALCDSKDVQRFATCMRSGCPVKRAREAAPILAPGLMAKAINDAHAGPTRPPPVPLCSRCSSANRPGKDCHACADLEAAHVLYCATFEAPPACSTCGLAGPTTGCAKCTAIGLVWRAARDQTKAAADAGEKAPEH